MKRSPVPAQMLELSPSREPNLGPRSLRSNFSWTLAGNVFYAGTQWGMLVVLAKHATAEMVGQFALGLAIAAPIMLFCNLQLRVVQTTDARRSFSFSEHFALRLITSAAALLLIAGITVVAGYRGYALAVVFFIGVAKAVESISDVFYGLMQQRERMDYVGRSLLWRGAAALALFSGALWATRSLLWALAGQILGWCAVLLFHDLRSGRRALACGSGRAGTATELLDWRRVSSRRMLRLTWLALPLGLTMMLISLNANIPRYLIQWQLGPEALGVFAALSYVVVAAGQVVQALGQAASPRLANHFAEGERIRFRSVLAKLLLIGVLLGAGGVAVAMAFGGPLLSLLYTPEYAAHRRVFAWLMAAGGVTYVASFLGYALTAMRIFRAQVALFAGVSAASALGCYWLVPRFGLVGAASAVLAAAVIQVAASAGAMVWAGHR